MRIDVLATPFPTAAAGEATERADPEADRGGGFLSVMNEAGAALEPRTPEQCDADPQVDGQLAGILLNRGVLEPDLGIGGHSSETEISAEAGSTSIVESPPDGNADPEQAQESQAAPVLSLAATVPLFPLCDMQPDPTCATPAVQAATPAVQAAMPVAQAATPAVQAAMPVAQAATPAVQAAMPVAQAATPAAQAATPAAQAATPAAQAATPAAQAATDDTPAASPEVPSDSGAGAPSAVRDGRLVGSLSLPEQAPGLGSSGLLLSRGQALVEATRGQISRLDAASDGSLPNVAVSDRMARPDPPQESR